MSRLLEHRRLVVTIAVLLALSGATAWFTMPRQEDPTMPGRWATIIVHLPGSEVEDVERWLVEPIEDELAEVDAIGRIDSTAQAGLAFFSIELGSTVYDTDSAWDETERALARAREQLPAQTVGPTLDRRWSDQHAVVLALSGGASSDLADGAERLRRALLAVSGVAHVTLLGDPDEQIVVRIDEGALSRHGVTLANISEQLRQQNVVMPGGVVNAGGRTTLVRSRGELRTVDELARLPVRLPSGAMVALENLAKVERAPKTPANEVLMLDGAVTVALAISAQDNVDLIAFGKRIREVNQRMASELDPVRIHEVSFQPDFVETRLSDLGRSLLLGVGVVAFVLFMTMGFRLGAVVASVVPWVAMVSVGLYAMGGGVLHQMSIAALVIALGLLVDNAIVIAENLQQRIDDGEPRWTAALQSVRALALPLGAATGTTLAAFVPMLLAPGKTGDFTRAIPIVIMVTLTVSYLAAVSLTPIMGAIVLKKSGRASLRTPRILTDLTRKVTTKPGAALAAIALAVAVTGATVPLLRTQFFPASDRQMVIVEVALPEGTHIEETQSASLLLQTHLLAKPEVTSVFAAVGTGLPRLYYNLVGTPARANVAEVAVATKHQEDVDRLIAELVRISPEQLGAELQGARVTPRRLEQGPPVLAPIELRITGDDLDELHESAETLVAGLRRIEGVREPNHDLGTGIPIVELEPSAAKSHRAGLARTALSQAVYAQVVGLPSGQLWQEDGPIDIAVRGAAGENTRPTDLESILVETGVAAAVPVAAVAENAVRWSPAAIRHRNRRRVATVTAFVDEGRTSGDVASEIEALVQTSKHAPGVSIERGGADAEADDANRALLQSLPIGLALLLFFLMIEFNSFRRTFIVLTTVPLAMVGIVPGLLLSQQPFGFMSLLGTFALAGIVVNSAIVLLDVIDQARREGKSHAEATVIAIEQRWRPIVLTTVTTIAGLLPLALTPSPLWPPLAFAMISGIVASTLLTLVAVPALYLLLFEQVPKGLRTRLELQRVAR